VRGQGPASAQLCLRQASPQAAGVHRPQGTVAAIREPSRTPVPTRDWHERRWLALPRRGGMAEAEPYARGAHQAAAPAARTDLPVRQDRTAQVPREAASGNGLGHREREDPRAPALLKVSRGVAAALSRRLRRVGCRRDSPLSRLGVWENSYGGSQGWWF